MLPEVVSLYDVIVIGAGPAGCQASKRCSDLGLKTLLIDRKLEIGAPLKDFEIVSSRDLADNGITPDDHWLSAKINKIRVRFADKETVLVLDDDDIYSIEADKFIKHLAALSSQAGTDIMIRTEAVAPIAESGVISGVIMRNGSTYTTERCGMVIYAGGYDSPFLEQSSELIMPRSTLIAKSFHKRIIGNFGDMNVGIVDVSEDLDSVMAVIPKGNHTANAIFIYRPQDIDASAKIDQYLCKNLKMDRHGSIQEVQADIYKRVKPAKIGIPGLLLAGDTAGINAEMWPFGIGRSMLSGTASADEAFETSVKGDSGIHAGYANVLKSISGSLGALKIMNDFNCMNPDMFSSKFNSIGSERHLKGQVDFEKLLTEFL
ncbi:MAG: NAD(P)/FAD-dependent oxidoreductase [Thermoplasmataceae archaeon]